MLESAKKKGANSVTLLNQTEAAKFLGVAVNWLEKRRGVRGLPGGPPFVRLGGFIRYRKADLEKYVRDLESVKAPEDAGEE